MKKLITLLLAVAGMVSTASATTLHIGMEKAHSSNGVYVYREGGSNPDSWDNMGDSQKATLDGDSYGRRWYHIDMNGNTKAQVRYDDWYSHSVEITGITGDDYYIYVSTTKDRDYQSGGKTITVYKAGQLDNPHRWNYMTFRQNIVNPQGGNGVTWDYTDDNSTSHPDGNTFTFELAKEKIDASSNKGQGIRFRLYNGDMVYYNDAGTYIGNRPQIYPSSDGEALAIAGNTTTYNHDNSSTSHYWQIAIPSYDYEKIVITAKYVNESGYKWKISADAYISKTIDKDNEYATFGTTVPVDLSCVSTEGATAYTVTADATTRKISKNVITGVLAANKGVLLENLTGSNITLSIPVSASVGSSSDNDMFAFTGGSSDRLPWTSSETAGGVTKTYTHYILANEGSGVGFYRVNSAGNEMNANTAYLKVLTGSTEEARSFLWFEEPTSINAVENAKLDGEAYNLAGQRVAQPTKGLYIVNGKKVGCKVSGSLSARFSEC